MEEHRATNPGRSQLAERSGLVALLVVQAVVGYEWFMSGLTKLWRGGFAAGLADELRDKSKGVSGWYRSILDNGIIPNAQLVGWLVLIGEIAIGIALIAGAVVWIAREHRLGSGAWQALLMVMGLASIAAIILNVNFHLANGAPHAWLIPKSGFDEGVDLDSLMPAIELVMVWVTGRLLINERRVRREADTDRPVTAPQETLPVA
jgi:hypothetical protein